MKETKTNNAPAAIGPYSQAITVGNMLFTSGQIPINPATGDIPEGVEAQAEQALTNVKNLIEAAGGSIENVVVYAKYFTEPYPARSCVEVARLPKDVLLEVETIVEL